MATNSLISYASCNCVGAAVDSATISNLPGFAALGSTPWVSSNFTPLRVGISGGCASVRNAPLSPEFPHSYCFLSFFGL